MAGPADNKSFGETLTGISSDLTCVWDHIKSNCTISPDAQIQIYPLDQLMGLLLGGVSSGPNADSNAFRNAYVQAIPHFVTTLYFIRHWSENDQIDPQVKEQVQNALMGPNFKNIALQVARGVMRRAKDNTQHDLSLIPLTDEEEKQAQIAAEATITSITSANSGTQQNAATYLTGFMDFFGGIIVQKEKTQQQN